MKVLLLLLLTMALASAGAEVERREINHAYVQAAAEKLAGETYKARRVEWPPFLRDLSYDDYQRIRFKPEDSLWRKDGLPFRVEFFHPGGLQQTPVILHEFTHDYEQRIPFVRTYYDYQDLKVPGRLPGSLEYAGFRVLRPWKPGGRWDEIVSFLGTNYFRALAADQRYGMSARGIAIDSGGPGGEEFPEFVEFWLGKPAAGDRSLTFHGLLDGPSVTGAYTFTITPGTETVVDVHATCFFRKRVANLGLAPLTSMFWFGENSATRFGDFRGEVHDSDGLLVAPDGDTRLWRPLSNPRAVRWTDFPATVTGGFGLMQRDRDYGSYEDAEARYERRPSVWVEPLGPWPEGRVRLVELPTNNEYADNVVAYWSPLVSPEPGQSLDFSYRLHWTNAPVFGGPPGWVDSTRQTVEAGRPKRTKFVVDFESAGLAALAEDAPVAVDVTVPPHVAVLEKRAFRNHANGSWRTVVLLDAPEVSAPVEIRTRLALDGKPITETWVDEWQP